MPTDLQNISLGTVAGIVTISFIITEVAKRFITEKTPVIGKIPVLLFPLLISATLAILANKVFKDDAGKPFLIGNIWTTLGTTIVSAATASGIFTWAKYPATTVGQAKSLTDNSPTGEDTTMKPLLLLITSMIFIGGCSCPQKAVLRESMDQATNSIRHDHVDWASKLTAYPIGTVDPRTNQLSNGKNQADQLPTLTPAQLNAIKGAETEYEGLVSDDRATDNKSLFGGK